MSQGSNTKLLAPLDHLTIGERAEYFGLVPRKIREDAVVGISFRLCWDKGEEHGRIPEVLYDSTRHGYS